MRIFWIAALAAMTLVAPMAAQAQDGAKLDCAISATTPEFRNALAQTMMAKSDNRDALLAQLARTTRTCANQAGFSEDQGRIYFDYTLHRINREWLIPELAKYSLDAALIDRALDFGPGRANPDLSGGMSDERGNAILDAFTAAGVTITDVPKEAWGLVGAYAAATSAYWRARSQLPQ
jgi:hypothetical protein